MLLGNVNKAHSGIASGVLNSARQTGSVIGVALFGSLIAKNSSLLPGTRLSLIISAGLLLVSSAVILGARKRTKNNEHLQRKK
jgi:DHA2 family methylenomycin A resistance protein-like MFS transporter